MIREVTPGICPGEWVQLSLLYKNDRGGRGVEESYLLPQSSSSPRR